MGGVRTQGRPANSTRRIHFGADATQIPNRQGGDDHSPRRLHGVRRDVLKDWP